jgi:hypothetical protein
MEGLDLKLLVLHYCQNGIINGWIRRTNFGNQSSYPFIELLQHHRIQKLFPKYESSYFIYGLFHVENSKLRSLNTFLAS